MNEFICGLNHLFSDHKLFPWLIRDSHVGVTASEEGWGGRGGEQYS